MPTRQPGRREGSTVAFLTDMHSGHTPQTSQMHNRAGNDLDQLEKYCKVIGLAGDNVNWYNLSPSAEDTFIRNWLASRKNPSKYLVTSGNHDLANSNESLRNPNRSGTAWASATGVPKYSHYPPGETEASGIQVVTLSQEEMRFNQWLNPQAAAADARASVKPGRGFVLSTAALNYLKARLETGRPTWIMIHYPLVQHIPNERFWNPDTAEDIADVITSYDNVIGVFSGHYHRALTHSRLTHRTSLSGNGRSLRIAGVNSPSAGGPMSGYDQYTDQPVIGTFMTYRPGKVIVRWRDLTLQRWVMGARPDGTMAYYSELDISCQVPIVF